MNTSGEVADLMVKEGIQVTESAVKLAGLGAKNLAAIIIALINDDKKLQGKTNLKQLLKSDKPLCILQIKKDDLAKFNKEAKNYGVLFTPVVDKTSDSIYCDILAKQDDVATLNYILEKLGYTAPVHEAEPEPEKETETDKADNTENKNPEKTKNSKEKDEKNSKPRARKSLSENKSKPHGNIENTDNATNNKASVKEKVEEIKEQKKAEKKEPVKSPEHSQPKPNKKKNKKKKGKSR